MVDSLLVTSCHSVGVNGYCELGTVANSAPPKRVVWVPTSLNPRVWAAPLEMLGLSAPWANWRVDTVDLMRLVLRRRTLNVLASPPASQPPFCNGVRVDI